MQARLHLGPIVEGQPVEVYPVDPETGLGLSHPPCTLLPLPLRFIYNTPHPPAVVQPTVNAFKVTQQKHGAFTPAELPGNGAGLLSER